jgi:predicted phosphodiesterase
VVDALARQNVDELVCLGDVAPGPQPTETVRRLRELGCPVVSGNWDAWLLDRVPPLPGPVADKLGEQAEWWSEQLGDEERRFLGTLAPQLEVAVDGASVLCVHGSPRSATEDILATTPDDAVSEMLDGVQQHVLAAGHTHVQLHRQHGSTLIVNPGSVGLPFHNSPAHGEIFMSPWAEYAIVTAEDGQVSTELRRAPYEVEAFLELARESGMPHAHWWTDCWVKDAQA